MICFVFFELKVGSCKGFFSREVFFPRKAELSSLSAGRGFYPVKPGYLLIRTLNYCLKKPHMTYIGDVRCDARRVFDYTSYFVTVGLSNGMQLRSLRNYSVMLELLKSLLCCPRTLLFSSPSLVLFPFRV